MNRAPRLAIAVLAVAGLLAAPAQSATNDTGLDAEYAAAYVNDARKVAETTGLPMEQVYQQILRQDAVGQLQQDAATRWPDTFGGLWIDPQTSLVHLAFTRDADANVAALEPAFADAQLLRAHTVTRSYADLQAVLDRMIADRALVQAGALLVPGLAGNRYHLDIDVRENRPVVVTDGFTAATVAAFAARYGDVRVDGTGTGSNPHACTTTDCRHYMRSGLAGDKCCSVPRCSLAFTVSSGQVNYESMSAGHCDTFSWIHGGETMGSTGQLRNSGRTDSQTIVMSSDFKAGPWIYISSGEPARKVTSAQLYASLAVGQWICKSGRSSGHTCGSVLSRDFTPAQAPGGPAYDHFMLTDMCDVPGDSGAGIFISGQAVGIIHGGNANTCSAAYRGWHSHIQHATDAMQLLVITSNPSAPFLSSISATGGTTGTINVKFSKPVRCSTVSASDFTARLQNAVNLTVTNASCTADSNANVVLTTNVPNIKATSLTVSISSNTITDPIGTGVGAGSRTTTVA